MIMIQHSNIFGPLDQEEFIVQVGRLKIRLTLDEIIINRAKEFSARIVNLGDIDRAVFGTNPVDRPSHPNLLFQI